MDELLAVKVILERKYKKLMFHRTKLWNYIILVSNSYKAVYKEILFNSHLL